MSQCLMAEADALMAALQQNGAAGAGQAALLDNPLAFMRLQQADEAMLWALGLQPNNPVLFVGGQLTSVGIVNAATMLLDRISGLWNDAACFDAAHQHAPMSPPPFGWIWSQTCCNPDPSFFISVHSPMETTDAPPVLAGEVGDLVKERKKRIALRREIEQMWVLPGIGRAPGPNEEVASAAKIKKFNELRLKDAQSAARVAELEIRLGYGFGPLANYGKPPGHKYG